MKGFSNKDRNEAAKALFVADEMNKAKKASCFAFLPPEETSRYYAQADACLEVAFAALAPRLIEQRDHIKELEGAKPIVGFNNTCEFCKFSQADVSKLRCQRHPPTIIFNPQRDLGSRIWSHFPKVSKDDWCGEWQYRGSGE